MWDLVAELNEVRGLTPDQGRSGGRSQREAVSAVERALTALRSGDATALRRAAGAVAELDVRGAFGRLPEALEQAARRLDLAEPPDLDAVRAALPPGPLRAELDGP
jgi:hypothetical protein